MPDSIDPVPVERLEALAAKVREASRSARLVRLDQVWTETEDEFLKSIRADAVPGAVSGFEDIALIRDYGRAYLYSERHMTGQYAEAAARAQCEDLRHVIAETVRTESVTYQRPTSVQSFTEPPFLFAQEALTAAIDGISGDPRYADIRPLRTSDGSFFLFSSDHLDPACAESLAEWIAVGSFNNP